MNVLPKTRWKRNLMIAGIVFLDLAASALVVRGSLGNQQATITALKEIFGEDAVTNGALKKEIRLSIRAAAEELSAANKRGQDFIIRNGIRFKFKDAPSGEPYGSFDPLSSATCLTHPLEARRNGKKVIVGQAERCTGKPETFSLS
jgi:hypothetical protein